MFFSTTICSPRCSGCVGNSAPPVLFGAQARGAKATWSMVLMEDIKSPQRVQEKHLMPLKVYIWNACSASNGQNICHIAKPQINELQKCTPLRVGQGMQRLLAEQKCEQSHCLTYSRSQVLTLCFSQLSQWDSCLPSYSNYICILPFQEDHCPCPGRVNE